VSHAIFVPRGDPLRESYFIRRELAAAQPRSQGEKTRTSMNRILTESGRLTVIPAKAGIHPLAET
jgi:hypothetical protein